MTFDLSSLCLARDAESRSISAENPQGRKGGGARATAKTSLVKGDIDCARELGQGWKVSPCRPLPPGKTVVLMDQEGPGVIRHVWFTFDPKFYRDVVLTVTWDGEKHPSIECPLGDFMACGWNARQEILAIPINVNPNGGMNCFLPMPFRKRAKIAVRNDAPEKLQSFFYTINYTLERVPAEALYLHAQWRRSNPLVYGTEHVLLDGVKGRGQYVGTFMAWQQNSAGWWGEGEIKMWIDGDGAFPTICGTGTEDYFGGAWNFGKKPFSAPFFGFRVVEGESEKAGTRMTLYRFHVADPVHFREDLKVTMQALGWRKEARYLPLQDDLSSVAYWYQTLPHAPFPKLPGRDAREII